MDRAQPQGTSTAWRGAHDGTSISITRIVRIQHTHRIHAALTVTQSALALLMFASRYGASTAAQGHGGTGSPHGLPRYLTHPAPAPLNGDIITPNTICDGCNGLRERAWPC